MSISREPNDVLLTVFVLPKDIIPLTKDGRECVPWHWCEVVSCRFWVLLKSVFQGPCLSQLYSTVISMDVHDKNRLSVGNILILFSFDRCSHTHSYLYTILFCLVLKPHTFYKPYFNLPLHFFFPEKKTNKTAGDFPVIFHGEFVRWVVWCPLPPARWFLPRRKHACDRWSVPWRRMWWCQRVSLDVFWVGEAIENWIKFGWCMRIWILFGFCCIHFVGVSFYWSRDYVFLLIPDGALKFKEQQNRKDQCCGVSQDF